MDLKISDLAAGLEDLSLSEDRCLAFCRQLNVFTEEFPRAEDFTPTREKILPLLQRIVVASLSDARLMLAARVNLLLGERAAALAALLEALRRNAFSQPRLLHETIAAAGAFEPSMEVKSELLWTPAEFAMLVQTLQAIAGKSDPKTVCVLLLEGALALTEASRGLVVLDVVVPLRDMRVQCTRGFADDAAETAPVEKIVEHVCSWVVHRGKPFLVSNLSRDARGLSPEAAHDLELQVKSLICLPIALRGGVAGSLYVDAGSDVRAFTPRHLLLLSLLVQVTQLTLGSLESGAKALQNQTLLGQAHQRLDHASRRLDLSERSQTPWMSDLSQFVRLRQNALRLKYAYAEIMGGESPSMQHLFRILDRVIDSDATVHLYGESGTGKELVARAIHRYGHRSAGPTVSINCGALSETLLESELFGHEAGAFTSAFESKKGLFELAHGGTLFLDEIGEMGVEMQVKLLRVLQEGEFRRLGGTKPIAVDVRIISAANQSLQKLVAEGRFREDLFYRLNVIVLTLPALRDRIEDLELLARQILVEFAKVRGEAVKTLTASALNHLEHYRWPGNVRELRNVLERCLVFSTSDCIDFMDLPLEIFSLGGEATPQVESSDEDRSLFSKTYAEAMAHFECRKIEEALKQCRGNVVKSAERLNMQRSSLRRKLSDYAIDPKTFKA